MSIESRDKHLANISKDFDNKDKKRWTFTKDQRFVVSKKKQSKFDNQVTQIFQILDLPMSNRITVSMNIQCLGENDEENISIVTGLMTKFISTLPTELISDDSLSKEDFIRVEEEKLRLAEAEESGKAKQEEEETTALQSIDKESFSRKSARKREDNENIRKGIVRESLDDDNAPARTEKTSAEKVADMKRELQLLEEEAALAEQVAAARAKKAKMDELVNASTSDSDSEDEDEDEEVGDVSDSDMEDLRFGYDN